MIKAGWYFLGAAAAAFSALYIYLFGRWDASAWLPVGGAPVAGAFGAYHVWRARRDEGGTPANRGPGPRP